MRDVLDKGVDPPERFLSALQDFRNEWGLAVVLYSLAEQDDSDAQMVNDDAKAMPNCEERSELIEDVRVFRYRARKLRAFAQEYN